MRRAEVFLLAGPAELRVARGGLKVAGAEINAPDSLNVPAHKRVSMEAAVATQVVMKRGEPSALSRTTGSTIPDDWEKFARHAAKRDRQMILILGETGTGKTFFTTFLANRLLATGRSTGILDTDTGQTLIGPPATIGFTRLAKPSVFLSDLKPDALFFTGSLSPAPDFAGYALALSESRERVAGDAVLVNTPGWVQNEGGRLVTRMHIELLRPDVIVLLERGNELEYVYRRYPAKVVRLPVSPFAILTSAGQRQALREESFREYFRGALSFDLSLRSLVFERGFFGTGIPIPAGKLNRLVRSRAILRGERLGDKEGILLVASRHLAERESQRIARRFSLKVRVLIAGWEEGLLVALKGAGGDTEALGILERIDYRRKTMTVVSPLKAGERRRIAIAAFGHLKLAPDGSERAQAPAS